MEEDWLKTYFDDQPVLNDRMITDAVRPVHRRAGTQEHSYSLSNYSDLDPSDDESTCMSNDLELDLPTFPISTDVVRNAVQQQTRHVFIKPGSGSSQNEAKIIVTTSHQAGGRANDRLVLPKLIKIEKIELDGSQRSGVLELPPTPPGSNSSSDNEGGSLLHSPVKQETLVSSSLRMQQLTNAVITDISKLPPGPLLLTEEERRTLIQEGYPVPKSLPLSKTEEKILKKIRRKIKNKISAQESRRKKKDYVDALEKMCENFSSENMELRKKMDALETANKSLTAQLQRLQKIADSCTEQTSQNIEQTETKGLLFP